MRWDVQGATGLLTYRGRGVRAVLRVEWYAKLGKVPLWPLYSLGRAATYNPSIAALGAT